MRMQLSATAAAVALALAGAAALAAEELTEQQAVAIAAAQTKSQCSSSTPCNFKSRRQDGKWYVLVQYTRRASAGAPPTPYPGGHTTFVISDAGTIEKTLPGR